MKLADCFGGAARQRSRVSAAWVQAAVWNGAGNEPPGGCAKAKQGPRARLPGARGYSLVVSEAETVEPLRTLLVLEPHRAASGPGSRSAEIGQLAVSWSALHVRSLLLVRHHGHDPRQLGQAGQNAKAIDGL